MSKCNHTLAEMDTAAYADGLCPLCLQVDNKRLQSIIDDMGPWASAGLDDLKVCPKLKSIFKRIVTAVKELK